MNPDSQLDRSIAADIPRSDSSLVAFGSGSEARGSAGERCTVSVVVPVYNGQAALPELVRRLHNVLLASAREYELILVNDGSRDLSWQVICELAHAHPEIRGMDLVRNFGQHNALLAGIRAARYGIVVTLDDDLQHPPEEIPRLLGTLDDGYQVVYGTPEREQHGTWRKLASQVTKLALQTTLGAETARKVGPFRAFRTEVREAFAAYQSPFVNIDVLLTWGASRFVSVPVRHDARAVGTSNYTFRALVRHAFNMVTGFTVLPLQLASFVGFACTLLGGVLMLDVVATYLTRGGVVPGFAFLASVITLFSGAQLFALGIIGEYLARIHQRTMDRPPYVVRAVEGASTSQQQESGRGERN